MGRNMISQGTSLGMKRWYIRTVPRCKLCRKTYLTEHRFRRVGVYAKCQKETKGNEGSGIN